MSSHIGGWVVAVLSNLSYNLEWPEHLNGTLQFAVFPMESQSNVTLSLSLSVNYNIEIAGEDSIALPILGRLPSRSNVSAAAYNSSTRKLSLCLVSNGHNLTQVKHFCKELPKELTSTRRKTTIQRSRTPFILYGLLTTSISLLQSFASQAP